MIRKAEISDCGLFRYTLLRTWDATKPVVSWCMLNPSKADHLIDDPTARKVVGFSKLLGFGSALIGNLGALRATNPAELKRAADPFGPGNERVLRYVLRAPIIVAWGAGIPRAKWADDAARILRTRARGELDKWWVCLGRTKHGEPRHPLMLPYRAIDNIEPWR